jgi:hypothetical protein
LNSNRADYHHAAAREIDVSWLDLYRFAKKIAHLGDDRLGTPRRYPPPAHP